MSTRLSEKHRVIVETAFNLFLNHGFAGTSMDNLAQKAGVSKATLYNHFKDKHQLFHEVMIWHCQGLTASFSFSDYKGKKSIDERLRSFADSMLKALLKPESIALMRVVIFEVGQFPDLGNAIWQGKLPLLDEFTTFLQAECDSGVLRIKHVELASRQFFGLIKENLVWPSLMGVVLATSPERTTAVIEASVAMFLSYYANKKE